MSCPSATDCTATGLYATSSGLTGTLAEHWNGTTWAIQSTPDPVGQFLELNAVSCYAATCTAAGDYRVPRRRLLVERILAERYSP